jgi:hypothetical protein
MRPRARSRGGRREVNDTAEAGGLLAVESPFVIIEQESAPGRERATQCRFRELRDHLAKHYPSLSRGRISDIVLV